MLRGSLEYNIWWNCSYSNEYGVLNCIIGDIGVFINAHDLQSTYDCAFYCGGLRFSASHLKQTVLGRVDVLVPYNNVNF